ncbi:hypothetical protein H1Z61_05235 [Bacillus aquiflavi]|uniref:M20 family metallopeptidase n=1 Tax=Bacillus aquiflavi TaxID=2672567 RepID=A0A6B3VXD4_9BACI|nr:M20 family metallopeptidase [Bacillus aquiflavi]MBA4536568.1 hypothetical protein [Bacillus aquiflavi]NEY80935.1 M20 family metallopeptidase [Bacillus aquiflavi]UAC49651.1 hypothetical protein K6959_07565 [Bacillus aquiflavi]
MSKVKTPIKPEDVIKRAEKKLTLSGKNVHTSSTGNIVKPVHIGKNDPLVKKMLGLQ